MTDDSLTPTSGSRRVIVEHQHARKKRCAKAILLFVVAFLAGIVIGVGGTLLFLKNRFHRRPPKPPEVAAMITKHMREVIALSPEEEVKVTAIIDEHMNEVDAMRRATFGSFRTVIDRMNDQISEVIGSERFEKWDKDKKSRFGKRKPPPDMGDGPPHERRGRK